MSEYDAENERVKRRYRVWLQDGQGYSEATIDQALAAIHAFEEYTGFRPFRRFHFEQARAFARDLKARTNPKTGRPYSKATLNGMFGALRKFFQWLGGEKDFRSQITVADAAYFRLNEKEARIARATRPKQVPEVEEVHRVIAAMPDTNDIEKRDRAVLAFILLTGARVSAVISAKIKHVDLTQRTFFQDAREVKTKRSKTFTTWFFPVGGDAEEILRNWVTFLVTKRGFGAGTARPQ
jgi:integrase